MKVMGHSDAGQHRHTACYPHEGKRPRAENVMILSTTCSGRLALKKWIVLNSHTESDPRLPISTRRWVLSRPSSPSSPLKEFVRPADSDGCRAGADA